MIDTTLLSGIYGAEKPNDPNGKPEDRLGDHGIANLLNGLLHPGFTR